MKTAFLIAFLALGANPDAGEHQLFEKNIRWLPIEPGFHEPLTLRYFTPAEPHDLQLVPAITRADPVTLGSRDTGAGCVSDPRARVLVQWESGNGRTGTWKWAPACTQPG